MDLTMRQRIKAILQRVLGRSQSAPMQHGMHGVSQKLLMLHYRRMAERPKSSVWGLADAGFQCWSQGDEDGILLYLLALTGVSTRRCIEICAGVGYESMSANLVLNHGFDAMLFEGDPELVSRGRAFFASHPATRICPPAYEQTWVTRGNINGLIEAKGFGGEVDVLALDLDGMDYWIWKAMEVVHPRIVVAEYNDILGPDRCVTVPYADDFNGRAQGSPDGQTNYAGASLRAFVKLGQSKGYRFVGSNRLGYNAFFVRDDLASSLLPEARVEDQFHHRKVREGMEGRFPLVKDLPWETV